MSRPIRIIDKRNKQYFMVDDAYLNGYAKHLGPLISMVYISLCRHVGFQNQLAFPSQELIASEIGAKKRSVINAIASLKKWNMIEVERDRSRNHGWARNNYYLLDKSVWLKVPGALNALRRPGAKNDIDEVHVLHTKDTHIKKDTHIINSKRKFSSLKDITPDVISKIAEDYKVSPGFVSLQFEKLKNYCSSKGKTYKNYASALRNFVLKDMQRIIEKPKKGGFRDASI